MLTKGRWRRANKLLCRLLKQMKGEGQGRTSGLGVRLVRIAGWAHRLITLWICLIRTSFRFKMIMLEWARMVAGSIARLVVERRRHSKIWIKILNPISAEMSNQPTSFKWVEYQNLARTGWTTSSLTKKCKTHSWQVKSFETSSCSRACSTQASIMNWFSISMPSSTKGKKEAKTRMQTRFLWQIYLTVRTYQISK